MRLASTADPALWAPISHSRGWAARRQRRRAMRMLLATASGSRGSALGAWAMSQAAPLLVRNADGRLLMWTWTTNPELLIAVAHAQELTSELRTARAMMPMEYDDTEDFPNPHLGTGEKLLMISPPHPRSPAFASYTWDAGSHLISLVAASGDRERFGTAEGVLDELARSIRIVEDLTVGETPGAIPRYPS